MFEFKLYRGIDSMKERRKFLYFLDEISPYLMVNYRYDKFKMLKLNDLIDAIEGHLVWKENARSLVQLLCNHEIDAFKDVEVMRLFVKVLAYRADAEVGESVAKQYLGLLNYPMVYYAFHLRELELFTPEMWYRMCRSFNWSPNLLYHDNVRSREFVNFANNLVEKMPLERKKRVSTELVERYMYAGHRHMYSLWLSNYDKMSKYERTQHLHWAYRLYHDSLGWSGNVSPVMMCHFRLSQSHYFSKFREMDYLSCGTLLDFPMSDIVRKLKIGSYFIEDCEVLNGVPISYNLSDRRMSPIDSADSLAIVEASDKRLIPIWGMRRELVRLRSVFFIYPELYKSSRS